MRSGSACPDLPSGPDVQAGGGHRHLPGPETGPFYGTFIEHWPAAVSALSMPHLGTVLPDRDAVLLAGGEGIVRRIEPRLFSAATTTWLQQALDRFPDGVFLRLGGRSFVTAEQPAFRVSSVSGALGVLGSPGDRAARMARRCRLAGRPVWLYARSWRPIAPDEEFRLVIRRRRLTAASQLHGALCFPSLIERVEEVVRRIRHLAGRLVAALHLQDVVADVWIPRDEGTQAELIELNPCMPVTGRALLHNAVMLEHPYALHIKGEDGRVILVPLERCMPQPRSESGLPASLSERDRVAD